LSKSNCRSGRPDRAAVGDGVDASRIGQRGWVYEANLGRPFGTAAQYTTVPAHKAVPLPDRVGFDVGACLGIPAITAHRCVFADGSVTGRTVLGVTPRPSRPCRSGRCCRRI